MLSAAALIAGCAAQRVIQSAAAGLPASQVATIVTAQRSKMGGSVSLGRVTDSQGRDAVSYTMLTADVRNSAIVVPGRYEIGVICVRATKMFTPSATFELRGGYTYTMECNRPNPFLVGVITTARPTVPRSDALVR
jgi:hypothetical protein